MAQVMKVFAERNEHKEIAYKNKKTRLKGE